VAKGRGNPISHFNYQQPVTKLNVDHKQQQQQQQQQQP
jgi:hypothetical protein